LIHRQLIINADDYGLTPGVSEGIIQGHLTGCITSTSVMINQFMHHRMEINTASLPNMGFGIHLNITTGKPILPPEDLTTLVNPDRKFIGVEHVFNQAESINLIQVEKEWRAQIIGFLIKFGRPDHIDSHHHVHLHPRFFPIVLQIAGEMRVPIRFPIQMDDLEGFPYDSSISGLSEDITREILRDDLTLLQPSGIRFPDYFCDDFITPNIDNPTKLLEYIHHLPEGVTEMMCHPGYLDDELFQLSSYTQIRVEELKALTAPQLRGLFEHEQVELINYKGM
jgi:chitin disaccharide deacetylase